MSKEILTQSELKQLVHYNPDTGLFIRKTGYHARKVGETAGRKGGNGYIVLFLYGKLRLAHRLAWLYVYGEMPEDNIDHINQDRSDNKINNLRTASAQENGRNRRLGDNNTSGQIGVCFKSKPRKWCAQIKVDNEMIFLGEFVHKIDAINARKKADIKYKFHINHGRKKLTKKEE